MKTADKQAFIKGNKLPESYLTQASIWFDPLVKTIIKHHKGAQKTIIVGLNGCQGSGKTTLADYLSLSFQAEGLKSLSISIDDFYLTHDQRQHLARDIHPMLKTRGVPGTHDLNLALNTLHALKSHNQEISIPRFDKATDDRFPECSWPKVEAPLDIIILEGWCLGIPAQAEERLKEAINKLESTQDESGTWRQYVNDQLSSHYPSLWNQIDCLIMLQAPSFDCVYQWRLEQEEKLRQKSSFDTDQTHSKIMSPEEVETFIQHYERLTRHSLDCLPEHCHHVLNLDNSRKVVKHLMPRGLDI
ncbi:MULTISPECIES: hypothetical protein [unclassified Oleiphilus]|uniref:hypothetical protein n=1 Tax=unclassified Oleiphilus TaxID=2631174 RepID=UPI0007C271F6|nr:MULTISPECIES: hypothetical protein [unclassified Oleiphilus]KZY46477.1 hypothetical protein A3732_01005 [Oleiphilus sp. HI0050]KZY84198.1 hypothetical protein A3741_03370 [Oleiphilus sp. HI0069]KZY97475.1 hypothetical protein A3743_00410 [Oleiphilus sp. HI0072]KZZ20089.1 hypothetical protein A3749_19780 [Oleiphilus sp. HI0078]KZZ28587.1 hypothetical protein A3752_03760 [Oleiphilus sp. HI0081]